MVIILYSNNIVKVKPYQSEVHDGFSHEFSQKAEFHLDLGDVSWLGAAAKRHSKKAP